jgi:hypothetical protein
MAQVAETLNLRIAFLADSDLGSILQDLGSHPRGTFAFFTYKHEFAHGNRGLPMDPTARFPRVTGALMLINKLDILHDRLVRGRDHMKNLPYFSLIFPGQDEYPVVSFNSE